MKTTDKSPLTHGPNYQKIVDDFRNNEYTRSDISIVELL